MSTAEQPRAWRKANPEKWRAIKKRHMRKKRQDPEFLVRERIRRHGLTLLQYETLLAIQNNACAICRRTFKKTPCIDHCHQTGKVRGILCYSCNIGVGVFLDDASIMERAAAYLYHS